MNQKTLEELMSGENTSCEIIASALRRNSDYCLFEKYSNILQVSTNEEVRRYFGAICAAADNPGLYHRLFDYEDISPRNAIKIMIDNPELQGPVFNMFMKYCTKHEISINKELMI